MRKRTLLACILICACLFSISAQGQSEKRQTIEIEYLTRLRAEEYGRDVLNTIAAEYTKANPDVRIKFTDVSYDDLRSQTLLKAQAGTPPNLTEPVSAWIPQLVGAGILEPVSNYMSEADLAKYVGSAVEDGMIDGVPYAVPLWHGPIMLYANKDLMTRAGLPIRDPKDMAEFMDWVEKISALDPDIIGFSMRNTRVANTGFWFVPWIWAFGGQLVDENDRPNLNSTEFKQALSFYAWCTKNGYSPEGIDASTSRILFAQERAGFVFDGPWLRGMLRGMTDNPDIDDVYQVLKVPCDPNGEPWTIANPTSIVVLKGAQNKEITFDFIKFMTQSPLMSELLAEKMGNFPTYLEFVENDPRMQTEFYQAFAEQMPYSRALPWKNEKWPGLEDILATAVSRAIAGENVDSVAQKAQAEFEELLR